MLKSIKVASKALQARLELEGHPNFFPSAPVVTTKEWDLLQTYDHRTLLCTVALRGTGGVWRAAVSKYHCRGRQYAGTDWQPGACQANCRAEHACKSPANA